MDARIDELVKQIANQVKESRTAVNNPAPDFEIKDYPLMKKHAEKVRTPSGMPVSEITVEGIVSGRINGGDIRISPEMLNAQAQIAISCGKTQMAQNFLRAAELTHVPDDTVIEMYDLLRPNRATKAQLLELSGRLKNEYGAVKCADLVDEALEVYEKRGILL